MGHGNPKTCIFGVKLEEEKKEEKNEKNGPGTTKISAVLQKKNSKKVKKNLTETNKILTVNFFYGLRTA